MITDSPSYRALEEIEGMVSQIKQITSTHLSRQEKLMTGGNPIERQKLVSDHRREVENLVNKIIKISRDTRAAVKD